MGIGSLTVIVHDSAGDVTFLKRTNVIFIAHPAGVIFFWENATIFTDITGIPKTPKLPPLPPMFQEKPVHPGASHLSEVP